MYNMGASTKPGYDIANKSREIIKSLIDDETKNLTYEERDIVERVVHSTADPEYAKLVKISPTFVETALDCFDKKEDILTDINMVKSGITRYDGRVMCYIRDEEGQMDARAVAGVPVGFVGAADSKEALSKTNIPYAITTGPKGGTPIAVAIINSLLNIKK